MNLVRHPWNVVFFVCFLVYVGIRHVYMKRTKGNEKLLRQLDALEKVLMGIVFLGSLLLPVVYLFTPALSFADYSPPSFAPWCGTAIMLSALWLFWRSHADLGLNFSMTLEIRKHHRLVKEGVYRFVRHPMYGSIWLFGLGQALLLPNWVAGFSALVTFAPLYFLRTPREEQIMLDTFRDEYRDYKNQTGKLFPHRSSTYVDP
jgi:protein-S-isoprenylcysteine O-methyltransferase Ste14